MSNFCCDERDVGGRVEAGLRRARRRSRTRCRSPSCRSFLPAKSAGVVMPLSLNDTCSVPERWKIWAMSAMLAPASRLASALGTQAMAKSASPLASCCLRHDVDAALEDLDVEALVLVEALVDGREVAGELGLHEPLQLQLHGLGRVALGRRSGRLRRHVVAGGRSVPSAPSLPPVPSVGAAVGGRRCLGRRRGVGRVVAASSSSSPHAAAISDKRRDRAAQIRRTFRRDVSCCFSPGAAAPCCVW